MKSKFIAYILLIFFGILGIHRFYLEKIGTGILYILTGGFLGIGVLIDLFTLSGQVDIYNLQRFGNGKGNTTITNNYN